MSEEKLLTTKDVALELGVHHSRVYALIDSGRLPAVRFGHAWVIKMSDVDKIRERKPGRPKK